MEQRISLANAARNEAAAASARPAPGNLIVHAPDNVSCTVSRFGVCRMVEVIDGRPIVRMTAGEFRDLCASPTGGAWAALNDDLIRGMAELRQPI
jgi:hypothetical protein